MAVGTKDLLDLSVLQRSEMKRLLLLLLFWLHEDVVKGLSDMSRLSTEPALLTSLSVRRVSLYVTLPPQQITA